MGWLHFFFTSHQNMSLDSCVLTQEASYKYKSVQMVGYVDDINLMGRSLREKKDAFKDLNREGKRAGFKINK